MKRVHGPHFVNSWVLLYGEPMDAAAIEFLRADTRARLKECADNGTIPKLADVRISRLIAALDASCTARGAS